MLGQIVILLELEQHMENNLCLYLLLLHVYLHNKYFKKLERPIMKSKDLFILLGNQLFPLDEIKKLNTNQLSNLK